MAAAARAADTSSSAGDAVAHVLAGSWRRAPDGPAVFAAQLELATPRLLTTGAGALGWWRVRNTVLEDTPAAANLHDAYRVHAAQAAVHARERSIALRSLAAAGIEALVIKGWAVARLYPEPGLRPYGDLDVAVHPRAYEHALAVLRPPPGEPHALDVHRGLASLDRDFEAVLARSRTVADDGLTVRLPAAEDHLRYLCLHFLKHGAWRPLWLCDVGAALEADPPDWSRLLEGEPRRSDWVAATLKLAADLLGADLTGAPHTVHSRVLPGWLPRSVLSTWSSPFVPHGNRAPLGSVTLWHPLRLARALRLRWPTPVEATMAMGAPCDGTPRLPLQVAECVRRVVRFAPGPPAAN